MSFHRLLSTERNDFRTKSSARFKVIGRLVLRNKRAKSALNGGGIFATGAAFWFAGSFLLCPCRSLAVIAKPLWAKPLLQITRPLPPIVMCSSVAKRILYTRARCPWELPSARSLCFLKITRLPRICCHDQRDSRDSAIDTTLLDQPLVNQYFVRRIYGARCSWQCWMVQTTLLKLISCANKLSKDRRALLNSEFGNFSAKLMLVGFKIMTLEPFFKQIFKCVFDYFFSILSSTFT